MPISIHLCFYCRYMEQLMRILPRDYVPRIKLSGPIAHSVAKINEQEEEDEQDQNDLQPEDQDQDQEQETETEDESE